MGSTRSRSGSGGMMAASLAVSILGAVLLFFAIPPASWAAAASGFLGIGLLIAAVRIWPRRRPAA